MKGNPIRYGLCRAYLTVTNFARLLKHVGTPHLGTRVIYNGQEMYISNGTSFPKWTLRKEGESTFKKPTHATSSEVRVVIDIPNIIHNATYMWRWYKHTWLRTDAKLMCEGQKIVKRF